METRFEDFHTKYHQILYPLKNLYVIEQIIACKKDFTSAEDIAHTSLASFVGYTLLKSSKNIDTINRIISPEKVWDKVGMPDFFCWDTANPHNYFFVEVKSEEDSIRMTQLEWYKNYPDFTTVIFVVKFRGVDNSTDNSLVSFVAKVETP